MKLHHLVATWQDVASARSSEAKVGLLAELLLQLSGDEQAVVCTWLTGELRQGRLGLRAPALDELLQTPASTRHSLRVLGVDQVFTAVDAVAGRGSTPRRLSFLRELFADAIESEQAFLGELLRGEPGRGVTDGLLLSAIALASGMSESSLRRAHMISGDIRAVCRAAFDDGEQGLAAFKIEPFRPMAPMLPVSADALAGALSGVAEASLEPWLAGARIQIHRDGDRARVWSPQLKELTRFVPEVVDAALAMPGNRFILDGVVQATGDDGEPLGLETTMGRFSRRVDVAEARVSTPLSLRVFDCMLLGEHELIDLSLADRRRRLSTLVPADLRR